MSPLFEIKLELGASQLYWRFILVIYLLSSILVIYTGLYLWIKFILLGIIAVSLKFDWQNKTPRNVIKRIEFLDNQWVLTPHKGIKQSFMEAQILIHNMLFQLILFRNGKQKTQVVLFQDQASSHQLRLLHLKIAQK